MGGGATVELRHGDTTTAVAIKCFGGVDGQATWTAASRPLMRSERLRQCWKAVADPPGARIAVPCRGFAEWTHNFYVPPVPGAVFDGGAAAARARLDKEIELINLMERLAVECRDEGARAKARSLARRHRQGLAEIALQLGLRKRLATAGKAELVARPMALWELAGEALGSVVALLRRVDGVVRDGVVAHVVRDALRPSEADRAVLADYAVAAPLASIATALRAQLAGLDKRAGAPLRGRHGAHRAAARRATYQSRTSLRIPPSPPSPFPPLTPIACA